MKQRDWLYVLGGSVAVAFAVAGCTDTNAGQPTTTSTSTSSAGKSGSSTHGNSTDPFEGMVACDVFDKALDKMDDWDFPEGKYDSSGGDNGCGSTIPQKFSTGLTLQPGGTLEEFGDDPSKLYDGDIKGRTVVEKRDGYQKGSCMLAMAVGENDRALLSISTSSMSRDEGCDLLEDIARKVEPLLPDEPS